MIISKAAPANLIQEIQAKFEPQLAKAFLEAIARIKSGVDWKYIEQLIAANRSIEAMEIVTAAVRADGLAGLSQAYRTALIAAGDASGNLLLDGLGLSGTTITPAIPSIIPTRLNISFDVTPPAVVQAIQTQQMDKIVDISQSTRLAIQRAIAAGVIDGQNPLEIAREIRQAVGLTDKMEQAVLNYRRMLEEGDLGALQRELRDRRFDPSVRGAAGDGAPLTPEKIDRMVQRYREKYLKYRAEMIARTETAQAISIGQHQMWVQAVQEGLIREDQIGRKWIYTQDGRTRHSHRSIPSMNQGDADSEELGMVGLMEPFQSPLGPIMYPGDPAAVAENVVNCRCSVLYRIRSDRI